MFSYIYDVESVDPWSNAWARYVYCHSVVFSPKSIFTDTIERQVKTVRTDFYQKSQQQQLQMRKKLRAIHDQLNQVRTDLYQESQQQLEIKKKLRSIRDQLNQAEEVPQGLLKPWELY